MSAKIICSALKSKHKSKKNVKAAQYALKYGDSYHFQCHPMVIERAISENWLPELAFFFKMKRLFVNSTVYHYTHLKLSSLSGIDRRRVSRYMSTLEKLGLVRSFGSHKTFLKLSRINTLLGVQERLKLFSEVDTEKYMKLKWTIEINKSDNLRIVQDKMIYKLMEFFALKQINSAHDKLDIRTLHQNDPNGEVSLKRVKYLIKKYGPLEDIYEKDEWVEDSITFGYRTLSIYTGLSMASIWRAVQRLQEYKYLDTHYEEFFILEKGRRFKLSKKVFACAKEELETVYHGHVFLNGKGYVKVRKASKYEFFQYKIF